MDQIVTEIHGAVEVCHAGKHICKAAGVDSLSHQALMRCIKQLQDIARDAAPETESGMHVRFSLVRKYAAWTSGQLQTDMNLTRDPLRFAVSRRQSIILSTADHADLS